MTPTTADKVKEIATKFFRYWWNQKGVNTDQGFDQWLATEEGSRLVGELGEGWISVENGLPEEDQNVLCASDIKNDVFTDMYWYSKGKFYAYSYPKPEYSVTHWMKLPEPPKIN